MRSDCSGIVRADVRSQQFLRPSTVSQACTGVKGLLLSSVGRCIGIGLFASHEHIAARGWRPWQVAPELSGKAPLFSVERGFLRLAYRFDCLALGISAQEQLRGATHHTIRAKSNHCWTMELCLPSQTLAFERGTIGVVNLLERLAGQTVAMTKTHGAERRRVATRPGRR